VAHERELDQGDGYGVTEEREDPGDVRRVEVGVEEVDEELGDLGSGLLQLVLAARGEDGLAQGKGAEGVECHEAARRKDADHGSGSVDHRQVVDPRGQHLDARLRRQHVGADR
jgi:hypothetical protein